LGGPTDRSSSRTSDPDPTDRVDEREPGPPPKPTLITVPHLKAPRSELSDAASVELSQRFADIWELADAEMPADAIARRIGQPIGQVELILALRRRITESKGSRA
jgi:hypothetical protein